MMRLFSLVFALFAGTLLPTQAGINAQLAKQIGNPLIAATVSFSFGSLALLLFTVISNLSLPTFGRIIVRMRDAGNSVALALRGKRLGGRPAYTFGLRLPQTRAWQV
jgi:hypothetical protein